MDLFSLLLPLGYLTTLLASLITFSHLYRRRKALATASLTPWFPPHTTRAIYLSLLEQASTSSSTSTSTTNSSSGGNDKPPKVSDSLLRAALLRRATTSIHRLIQLRTQKPALTALLARGAVGDTLFQRFSAAERELEAELKDVVAEANALAGPGSCGVPGQGWGSVIFQSAGECAQRELLMGRVREGEGERAGERGRWEERRGLVREGFLRDVGMEVEGGEGVGVVGKGAEARPGSSDDDGVVVEGSDAGSPGGRGQQQLQSGGSGGGGGGKKKNKNKNKAAA